jgi:diguanylate cyclase (GGDEF)-like protein/PAS domain S-box-containing protein
VLSKFIRKIGELFHSPLGRDAPKTDSNGVVRCGPGLYCSVAHASACASGGTPACAQRAAAPRGVTSRLDAYRQALEEHFCITTTDSSGRLLEVNARFCDVTGYAPEELVGQHYDLLSSGRQAPKFIEQMWETVRAGRTWRGEFCDRSKSGDEIWFESIVIPRFSSEGTIDHFITISTEVTPIHEQADTLQAMIDHFPGGIALIDRDGRLAASNKLYRTLHELPESLFADPHPPLESLVRFRAVRGDYGPGEVDTLVANRLKTLLSPEPNIDERQETTGKTLEIRCVPIPGGGHLNTYVDVSDRRKAEQELRRAHARLEAFIKHAPAAVAMFDTEMKYVAHSDRWLQDYHLPDESLVGRSHYDVFPEIPPHWKAKHKRILAGATEHSPEEEFKRADGSVNVIRWEVRPWYLENKTVGGMMMLTEEISERKKLEQQLWRLAKLDNLTELPNRLQFNENLKSWLEAAKEKGEQFAVGLIDLDRFKETNDILGHAAGDQLLKELATRLDRALKPFGTVARLGGDEFAVMVSARGDGSWLKRAVDAIFATTDEPVMLNGVRHRCTISLGLTIYPSDATTESELLKNADLALYCAKEHGRDRFRLYSPEMRAAVEKTYQLHQDIQSAIATDSFCLLYQPIISLSNSRPVSFEALLRWDHPQRGRLSPAEFEEVFEDPKTASEIGKWVLNHAVQQIAAWEQAGLAFGRVAINVTSADFALGGFAELIEETLQRYGVGPQRICVEVTEHVFLGRSAVGVSDALQKLHDMGVEIALDDFGTGFGSLTHIKRFPIDRLKVDRSFVRDMEVSPDNMAIVRTITQLGDSLGLEITIEGVETDSQLTLLRAMGCDSMQGFLFSKPLDPAKIPDFLSQDRRALSA